MPAYTYETVVISSGQTASAELDLRGKRLVAVKTPTALTGNTLTFHCAEKPTELGGAYVAHSHLNTLAATATTITSVAANQWITIQGSLLPGGIQNCMVKLVSGSAEGANRTFIVTTSLL